MSNERQTHPHEVEDFTNAFLASFGVIVFMVLFSIWAVAGILFVALFSWIADRLITVDFRRTER